MGDWTPNEIMKIISEQKMVDNWQASLASPKLQKHKCVRFNANGYAMPSYKMVKLGDIPIYEIKKYSRLIFPILSVLYNKYISDGFFPVELKVCKPIYKKR